jgi:hypothetical protein
MNIVDFLDAHRYAFSGIVFWLVINVQAVRFMARAKDTFGPLPNDLNGMSATITQQRW